MENVVAIDKTTLISKLNDQRVERRKYVFINGYRITQQEYDCATTGGPWFEQLPEEVKHEQ